MVDREQFLVIGLVVLSSFIHALDGVIVKWISNMTAMELTFWRMAIQTIILVPVCHFRFEKFLATIPIGGRGGTTLECVI